MLLTFNLVYTVVSMPAGSLSERIDRRKIIVIGWLIYAFSYLGFALSRTGAQIWVLYGLYGIYYGMAYGTSKAIIADIVPAESRGTAYGVYSAVLGLLNLPSSVIAGLLWEGAGTWEGFGPSAPFVWGAHTGLCFRNHDGIVAPWKIIPLRRTSRGGFARPVT